MRASLSIIIPTHRRANLLRRALNSIQKQRNYLSVEIIVVSDLADADTDAVCYELLTASDIYVRRNKVSGPSLSRNIGIKLASAKNLFFLDDDDEISPDFLRKLSEIDNLNGFNYFNFNVVDESRDINGGEVINSVVNFKSINILSENIYLKNQLPLSAFLFPNDKSKNFEFDHFMKAYEDWDFVLNYFNEEFPKYYDINSVNVYQVSSGYTDRRGSSSDANNFHAILDYLYVYKRHPANSDKLREKELSY